MKPFKFEEKFKKWVRYTSSQLLEYFNLQEWNLDLIWETVPEDGTVASINIDNRYLQATMKIYPLLYEHWQEESIYRAVHTLVHEFCHVLTEPLYDIALDAITNTQREQLQTVREQQTQRIAKIVMRNIPKHIYTFPKI